MKASHGRSRGFSLVELMVAMVLGLIITGAAVSLFTTNQKTFALQQAMGRVQEQGDLAMRFINQDIRMAGYMDSNVAANFIPGVLVEAGADGIPAGEDGGNDSDRLTLSYHGNTDCEGNGPAGVARTEIVNTYWVDDGKLRCRGNQSPGSTGMTLLEGVSTFQVLYGIDEEVDGITFASRYVTADDVVDQETILAVKVGLLLEADLPSIGNEPDDKRFYILDQEMDLDASGMLRRQFFSTVAVRNYPWDVI